MLTFFFRQDSKCRLRFIGLYVPVVLPVLHLFVVAEVQSSRDISYTTSQLTAHGMRYHLPMRCSWKLEVTYTERQYNDNARLISN